MRSLLGSRATRRLWEGAKSSRRLEGLTGSWCRVSTLVRSRTSRIGRDLTSGHRPNRRSRSPSLLPSPGRGGSVGGLLEDEAEGLSTRPTGGCTVLTGLCVTIRRYSPLAIAARVRAWSRGTSLGRERVPQVPELRPSSGVHRRPRQTADLQRYRTNQHDGSLCGCSGNVPLARTRHERLAPGRSARGVRRGESVLLFARRSSTHALLPLRSRSSSCRKLGVQGQGDAGWGGS